MKNGAVAKPMFCGEPRPLTREDLAMLVHGNRTMTAFPAKLRDSHHRIARLAAAGLRPGEIAQRCGYGRERVGQLLTNPAMEELVARYREKVDEAFAANQDEYYELATSNMLAAERHIADQIAEADEAGELLPIRTALAISRDAADRFGYGKRQTNVNVNVDFAAQLERAIQRSGKQIDGVVPSQAPHQAGRVVASAFPALNQGPGPSPRPLMVRTQEPVRLHEARTVAPDSPESSSQPIRRRA